MVLGCDTDFALPNTETTLCNLYKVDSADQRQQMPIDMDLNITLPHSYSDEECNQLSNQIDLNKEPWSNDVEAEPEPEPEPDFMNVNETEEESEREMDDTESGLHFDERDSEDDIELESEPVANIAGTPFLHLLHSLSLSLSTLFTIF